MNIYIFKSEASRDLRAFSDDQGGQKLPKQFRPWHAVGVVKPGCPAAQQAQPRGDREVDRQRRLSVCGS